jgi:dTDP-4-amino-4,6-dideoxygalactose transaminase
MIPLFKVYMPATAGYLVQKVMYSGYLAEGKCVQSFEDELKKFLKCDNVITVNSCTSAIHLALKLFGASEFNNYVLSTPVTCVASNASIVNLGATPIWVDVDPKHGMITSKTLRRAYNECRYKGLDFKIAALIYVCWGGDIGPLKEVSEVCKELGIPLIVDAAQAFGGIPKNLADIICYSFQAIKHITTGDGGAMQFKDTDLMQRAINLKWFGINRDSFRTSNGEINWSSDIPEIGFKFHMNNIAGAIGTTQLQDSILKSRLRSYNNNDVFLTNSLRGILERSWTGASTSWVSTFLCEDPIQLMEYLNKCKIHTSQMHINNNIYTGFNDARTLTPLTGAEEFMQHHICIPCGWWLKPEDLTYIIKTVKNFYGKSI